MRIFGIFMLTGLGIMLSVVSVNGSFQDFTLVGFSGVSFALSILILFVGVATGVLLMEDNHKQYLIYYDRYYKLVKKHDKLTLQRDDLRLDAIRQFDRIFSELKRLKNEKR